MKKIILPIICLMIIVGHMTGCVEEKKVEEKILIFGMSGDADKLDPADVTDGESISRMDNIFEGLVEYTAGGTDIQPALATSWNISDDGLNITLILRKNVTFHDGTEFNADAVVFSFENTKCSNDDKSSNVYRCNCKSDKRRKMGGRCF